MPFQALVDTFQGKLATYVLIAIRILPCNGAPALLEQAFDAGAMQNSSSRCASHTHL